MHRLSSDALGNITKDRLMNKTFSMLNTEVTDEPVLEEHTTQSILQSRNVRIHKRRTSVRLEPEMWNALNEIAELEGCSVHDLCGAVHDLKEKSASFTAALRVFMMEYYRSVALTNNHVSQIQKKLRHDQAGI